MIDEGILKSYGAVKVELKKDGILFHEGDHAHFYYQVESGEIKMSHYSGSGKEFVQKVFDAGESFGEPPLFGDFPYPSSAEAVKDSTLWKLSKDKFLQLLKENPEIHLEFTRTLAQRLRYKAIMQKEMAAYDPSHRILTLIDHYKEHFGRSKEEDFEVPFTRQQIADMTGLRVETVIRSIKELEEQGELRIEHRKVHR